MKIILTNDQIFLIIKEQLEISEIRHGHFRHAMDKIKQITHQEWPEYVVKDWLYKNTKDENEYRNLPEMLVKRFLRQFGRGHWEEKELMVSKDIFSEKTLEMFDMTHSPERMEVQNHLLAKTGAPSIEPIILVDTPNGYELIEGFNRTKVSLQKFGSYKQLAYIYHPDNI